MTKKVGLCSGKSGERENVFPFSFLSLSPNLPERFLLFFFLSTLVSDSFSPNIRGLTRGIHVISYFNPLVSPCHQIPARTHRRSHLEEDNLLQIGQDLLQLLLTVQHRGVERDARGHAVNLHPQVLQPIVRHI